MTNEGSGARRRLIEEPLFLTGAGLLLLAMGLLPLDERISWALRLEPGQGGAGVAVFVDRMLPRILLSVAALLGLLFWTQGRTPRRRFEGLALALVPLVANRITGVIKVLVGRERPQLATWPEEGWRALVELADQKSFPSGHVTTAAAFVIVLVWILRERRWIAGVLLLLIPLTMWGRVAAFVHYASDTVAGVGVACLTALAFRRILAGRVWAPPAFWRGPLLLGGWLFITWLWRDPVRARDLVTWEVLEGLRTVRPLAREILEPFLGPVADARSIPPLLLLAAAGAALLFRFTRSRASLVVLLIPVLTWGAGAVLVERDSFLPDRVVGREEEGISADLSWSRRAGDLRLDPLARRGVRIVAARGGRSPETREGVLVLPLGLRRVDENLWLIGLKAGDPTSGGGPADLVRAIARDGAPAYLGFEAWRGLPASLAGSTGRALLEDLAGAGLKGILLALRSRPNPPRGDLLEFLEWARGKGLLLLSCGDGGDRPGGAVFLPGMSEPARGEVMERLSGGERIVAYARASERVRSGPLWEVWDWFVTMGSIGRLAWMAWFVCFWWFVRRGASASGGGKPEESGGSRRGA